MHDRVAELEVLSDAQRHVVAAMLTTAAEVRALRAQLAGERMEPSAAQREVQASWASIAEVLGAETPVPATPPSEVRTMPSGEALPGDGGNDPMNDTMAPADCAGPAVSAAGEAANLIGGRYRVIEKIGAGGMGQIMRAEQVDTGRIVALKLLPRIEIASDRELQLFAQEARALGRLEHPSVAQIFDADLRGRPAYIAMELVQGSSVADVLKARGPLPSDDVEWIIREALTGLAAIHESGVIHRDLKPDHLVIAKDGRGEDRVKIIDLGLAILDRTDAMGNETASGAPAGTPLYMSPEQIMGAELTAGTDLYSLGVVAYELLTGENPFRRPSLQAICMAHHSHEAPHVGQVSRSGPSAAFADAIHVALRKEPSKRFASARDFLAAIG